MSVCHLWTPSGSMDRCGWCLQPRRVHRFVSCPVCAGWATIPDPNDRTLAPTLEKQRVGCPRCTTGWVFRHDGSAATEQQLTAVGWRKPAG